MDRPISQQSLSKLNEANKLIDEGQGIKEACKKAGLAVSYYYRLKEKVKIIKPSPAVKNIKRKTIIAEPPLPAPVPRSRKAVIVICDISDLKETLGKLV